MTATYIPTSQVANDPAGILWLEKRDSQPGKTTLEDIQDALKEYSRNFNSGNVSKAEILTLHRAYPDSPTYKQAAVGIQKMDMVDPLVIGGPASVEMIDREGHLITTNALSRAFQKFMDNQRTRNVMVLHSDVQVGWALPAYISKGGQIFKSGVGENGLFFICELRDDTAISKKVADQINQGMLKSYSIAGSATKIQNMKKGETPYMQVDEMELAEVTICEKGVNQGASFELLKAELPQTGKIDKDQCGYRDATAPEEKMGINCGHCKYFNSDTRTCDVVVGDIMPGDYCRLFEQEEKPKAIVHRKIIIMHKDDTGRINFKDSFMGWMEKEKAGEDPLKSGKSFATLNNIAGREAEHHRLLEEYGFPSEPDLDTMRYIPVVETETDDDGKPINIIPPWVVNEAGQDLGDKLDNDTIISVNKSMEIIDEILRKARSTGRLERDAKKKGFKPAKAGPRGTRVKAPRPFMQPKVEPTPVDPETDEEKKAIDKASGDTPRTRQRRGGPQRFTRRPGERTLDPNWFPSDADKTRESASDASARSRATTIGDPTQIKKPIDKANGDPSKPKQLGFGGDMGPDQAPPQPGPDGQASSQPGLLSRLGRQFGQGMEGGAAAVGRGAGALAGGAGELGRQAGQVGRQVAGYGADLGRGLVAGGRQDLGAGAQRLGELFGAGKKRLGEAGQAVKRGAIRADLAAGEAGRRVKAGAQEVGRRAVEGGRRVGAAGQEAGKRVAAGGRELGRRAAVDARAAKRGAQAVGRRAAIEGRRAGRGAQEGGRRARAGAKEAYRRGAEGAREFGGGLREGFGSYDRDARTFDEIRSGGGQRDQFGNLRRTAADGRKGPIEANRSGARRIGQLFGAGGRATGEMAGEGTRMAAQEAGRFGRGVARGAAPGQAGRDWRGREQGDDAGSDRQRSASERFGQWLSGQGRERTADVLDTTGQTARGFGRGIAPGERGKRLRAEEAASGKDRTWGEKIGQVVGTSTRGAGRQGGNVATQAGRDIPRFGSKDREKAHMMNNEGVGKGVNFQPNAHRGVSLNERHQLATGLADRINAGENMSPKEWMQVVHHMSQTPEGERFANFSDIDISHGDWNKPISFSDMKQHLDRMNVGHGTHGDMGKRSYDKLVAKLENVTSRQGDNLSFKAPKTKDEGPTHDTNYDNGNDREEEEQPDNERKRRFREDWDKEQDRLEEKERRRKQDYEGSVMKSYGGQPVTDTFKRAFKISV